MYFVEYWMLERTNCCASWVWDGAGEMKTLTSNTPHSPAESVGDGPAAETTHHAADGEY
jgi:hypothetical protein